LPEFFTHLQTHFQSVLQRNPAKYTALSYQNTKIFAVAYNGSASYRLENEKLYKIDQRRLIAEPWNASLDLIQMLQGALEVSIDALRQALSQTSDLSTGFLADPNRFLMDFKGLFCELARLTLGSFHSLKSYYTSLNDLRQVDLLWGRYQVVQTKVIDSMRNY
jgi:hypothetical protein